MKNLEKFKSWLRDRGCEILPPTSEYELLRFKGSEVGVIYTTGKVSGLYVNKAIGAFYNNTKWAGQPVNIGRKNTYKKDKVALLKRDGKNCFLCGKALKDDITLEHLIALSSGGKNTLANMVLMHEKCNQEVKNLPLNEKINLTIKYRSKLKIIRK